MMRIATVFACAFCGLLVSPGLALELVRNGKSDYVIVGNRKDPSVQDLKKYIHKMTGAELPLQDLQEGLPPVKAIVLTSDSARCPGFTPAPGISRQGFQLKVVGQRLVLYSPGDTPEGMMKLKKRTPAQESARGLQFAPYALLDDYFGCRFLTKTVEYVPRHQVLAVPDDLNDHQEPSFLNRKFIGVWNNSSSDLTWKAKNRVGYEFVGISSHSFNNFLPGKRYFQQHPEWYPLKGDGTRDGKACWFCWSNPEVADEFIKVIADKLRKEGYDENKALPVGQGDGPVLCHCANCQKINEEYGSPHAACLLAWNRIARALEKEFPQQKYAIFAYFNTDVPPGKGFKLHRNIVISYVRTGDQMKSFFHPTLKKKGQDYLNWNKVADEITIWDWDVNFGNTLMPFPNVAARAEDIRFYAKNSKTTGMSPQILPAGDFIELREWLFSRMMWNVNTDIERMEREFVRRFYGEKAGEIIFQYLKRFQQYAYDDKGTYNAIFGGYRTCLVKTLFTPQRIAEGEKLFMQALEAARKHGTPEEFKRLELTCMSGFIPIRLMAGDELKVVEDKDGSRYLLPNGDLSLSYPVTKILDLLIQGTCRMDEWGGVLFQAVKMAGACGAKIETTGENSQIKLGSSAGLGGGLVSLIDKKTGMEILDVDNASTQARHGLLHLVGARVSGVRPGVFVSQGKEQMLKTYGRVSTNIWWTPEALPVERTFTMSDERRGFSLRCSFKENPKETWAFKALQKPPYNFNYGVPLGTPSLSMLLKRTDKNQVTVFMPNDQGGRYWKVTSAMPLILPLTSVAPAVCYIMDEASSRPAVRLSVQDPVWQLMTLELHPKRLATRVNLTTKEKLGIKPGETVPCGGLDLDLMDLQEVRDMLPPARFTVRRQGAKVLLAWNAPVNGSVQQAQTPAGPWQNLGNCQGTSMEVPYRKGWDVFKISGKHARPGMWKLATLRQRQKNHVSVASTDGDAFSLEDAYALLPETPWTDDVVIDMAESKEPYVAASIPQNIATVMNGHRLVFRGKGKATKVIGTIRCARLPLVFENLHFENLIARNGRRALERLGGHTTVRNCTFINFDNALDDRSYKQHPGLLVENCLFKNCNNPLMFITSGGTPEDPVIIRNNRFENCGSALFHLGPKNLFFTGNHLINSGIRIDYRPQAHFTANVFSGSKATILFLNREKTAENMVFEDNVFEREQNLMRFDKKFFNLKELNQYFNAKNNRMKTPGN